MPDTEACAVSGRFSDGAYCNHTLSEKPRKMTMDEFLDFLEPDINAGRGAAICQSASDWIKIKTALEQACYLLKNRCTIKQREAIGLLEKKIKEISDNENLI